MIIVTGGAGLIGSAVLWGLNQRGETNILVVDDIDHDEKEHNLAPLKYEQRVGIDDFRSRLSAGEYSQAQVNAVLHLGAISSTSETNWDRLLDRNVTYTQEIIRWSVDRGVRCVYASSAQTYGAGDHGYSDDHELFDQLATTTLYGKSKLMVDMWARDAGYLDQVVGLRYFNVFGPNEYHKAHMRSVILKEFTRVRDEGKISLFKSHRPDCADGEQQRDFLYITDAVAATLFFLDSTKAGGVYNVGTGQAQSWNTIARGMFSALNKPPVIDYIPMPDQLQSGYQYFTQADITKLRSVGFDQPFTAINDAVKQYVQRYLVPHHHLGEANE